MFLERKFQNFFFLIFIIILVWVTPLYFVKANNVKIKPKTIPPLIMNSKMNSKLNNTLLLPAKLTFELDKIDWLGENQENPVQVKGICKYNSYKRKDEYWFPEDEEFSSEELKDVYSLTKQLSSNITKFKLDSEVTSSETSKPIKPKKNEKNCYYKLTFEDNNLLNLLKELDKNKKELKDLSLVCHLNTSIFDSDNKNNLTDLFDIECSIVNLKTDGTYEIEKTLQPYERKFSFYRIDLEKWEYYIRIKIKTKNKNNYLKKYKELENKELENKELENKELENKELENKESENKKIKLLCELDITYKDDYPVYLFNSFDKFRNENKENEFFLNMFRTNYDFDFSEISSNPILLVPKDGKFIIKDKDSIINQEVKDSIINQAVEYKNYKTYQDLMRVYYYAWISKIKEEENVLIDLNSQLKKEKNIKQKYNIIQYYDIKGIKSKLLELQKNYPDDYPDVYAFFDYINEKKKSEKDVKLLELQKNYSDICEYINNINLKKNLTLENLKNYILFKFQKSENLIKQLKEEIEKKEKNLNNLNSKLEENILFDNKNNVFKFKINDLNDLKLKLKEEIEKKEKNLNNLNSKLEENILFNNNNNVSRIKLYFHKKIYDINNSFTYSSLHFKQDWDIGKIGYDGASDDEIDEYLSKIHKSFEDSEKSAEKKFLEIKKISDQLENKWKNNLSEKDYYKVKEALNNENWKIVIDTIGIQFKEFLENNYTYIGNKKIKTLQEVKKTKKDHMKKNKINISVVYNHNSNYSSQKNSNKQNSINYTNG